MVKRFFILLFFVFTACNLSHKDRVKIGDFTWFTEYGYAEALEKAEKENKPIFVYFTANWCGPCKRVKKEIFEKKEFKKIADKVVLLRVEQTEIPGTALCRKYHIITYPSFRLLSPDGKLLDKGWSGWVKGKTVDDVYKWLEVAEKKMSPSFSKKPMPLSSIMTMFNPPFNGLGGLSDKQQAELLLTSLKKFSDSKNGKISDGRFTNLSTSLVFILGGMYSELKSPSQRKNFLKRYDREVLNLISRIKDKQRRNDILIFYLQKTGRAEKALTLFTKTYGNEIPVKSGDDIRILRNKVWILISMRKEGFNSLETSSRNFLQENLKEEILSICDKIKESAIKNRDNGDIVKAAFWAFHHLTRVLYENRDENLASLVALKAFDTFEGAADFSKLEFLQKGRKLDPDKFDDKSFFIILSLEEFSDWKLIPERLLDFGLKYYKKANIWYRDRIAITVFENYFTKGEYKKGMDFIENFLMREEKLGKDSFTLRDYRLYYQLAWICLDNNVYLDRAEEWAKKAFGLRHKNEYALFTLARVYARKKQYPEALNLAKEAYKTAIYREHVNDELVSLIKKSIKEWKNKL